MANYCFHVPYIFPNNLYFLHDETPSSFNPFDLARTMSRQLSEDSATLARRHSNRKSVVLSIYQILLPPIKAKVSPPGIFSLIQSGLRDNEKGLQWKGISYVYEIQAYEGHLCLLPVLQ
jgi:hypothetical protein